MIPSPEEKAAAVLSDMGPLRVKIFQGSGEGSAGAAIYQVETEMNNWLAANPKAHIVQFFPISMVMSATPSTVNVNIGPSGCALRTVDEQAAVGILYYGAT